MLGTAFFAGIFFHSVSPLLYIFFALAGMGWAFINVNSYPMVVELSKARTWASTQAIITLCP